MKNILLRSMACLAILKQDLMQVNAVKLHDDDLLASDATRELVSEIIAAKPDLALSSDGQTLSDSQVDQIQSLIASQASET